MLNILGNFTWGSQGCLDDSPEGVKKGSSSGVVDDSIFKINGKIDEAVQQGQVEDCWLIAGLKSMSETDVGCDITQKSVKDNKDGSYTVKFNGIGGERVKVTQDEMLRARNNNKYSKGDDDMLLFELAFEKVLNKMINGDINTPSYLHNSLKDGNALGYGFSRDVVRLLCGGETEKARKKSDFYNTYDLIENNPRGVEAVIAFQNKNAQTGVATKVLDENENEVELVYGQDAHAWCIQSVQGDTVTIIDPFDTSVAHTIPKANLDNYILRIDYFEF